MNNASIDYAQSQDTSLQSQGTDDESVGETTPASLNNLSAVHSPIAPNSSLQPKGVLYCLYFVLWLKKIIFSVVSLERNRSTEVSVNTSPNEVLQSQSSSVQSDGKILYTICNRGSTLLIYKFC